MCGRFTQRTPPERIAERFEVEVPDTMPLRYNVAPTQDIAAVRGVEGGGRELAMLRWGLIPSWAKDASISAKLINARSETVTEKPSFREAFKRRRCVIPADGFYEWRRDGAKKQPFYFRMRDESPFGFAGLWEGWEGPGGEAVTSCTILTTEANDVLRPVHDRMPVIIHPEEYSLWLGGEERERAFLQDILRPYPAGEMVGYPVSPLVNSSRSQGPELIEQLTLNSA